MNVHPVLGEEGIQAWVGGKAFQRGYRYYEDDAILNPRRRGESLIAECQGTQPAPYRVEVHLSGEGIRWGNCTCTAGEGGHCKHAAALLLSWLHEPEIFSEVPELEILLENHSKAELISLIQQMVARYPDLEQLLELNAMSSIAPGQPLQAELIMQQIRRAFSSAGGEWGNNAQIAENLQAVLDLGSDLLDRQDISNAAIVFQALMESMLAYEDSLFNDEGGDLTQILSESEQGIDGCLAVSRDADVRRSLLRTLFEFFLWDLNNGGMGFADETPAILVERSTPEEKIKVASWIQAKLPDGEERSDQHQRRALGGLWLDLSAGHLEDELYLTICAKTGRTRDMTDRLLSLGRLDEALEIARKEPVHTISAMADLFEKHGFPELSWQLVHEQPNSETDPLLLEWLKQYSARHHQLQDALRLSEILFWRAQSLENYKDLLAAASALEDRTDVRERVLRRLESAGNFSLLVEIYLSENETDLALLTLERVNPEIWYGRLTALRRQVAEAVEIQRPREAIRQYLLLTQRLIDQRSRGSYAEAARFLQRVRKLYLGLGKPESWEQLTTGMRHENRRLPALLDELRRAGL